MTKEERDELLTVRALVVEGAMGYGLGIESEEARENICVGPLIRAIDAINALLGENDDDT